jgi:hypothetical protein
MKTTLIETSSIKLTIGSDHLRSQYRGKNRLFYIEHCSEAGNHYYGIKMPYLYIEVKKFI